MAFSPTIRLAAALLLAGCAAGAEAKRHPIVQATKQRFGEWHLTISTDMFSGQKSCRLAARHLSVERGALIVHLPAGVDTMNAVYRLDEGAPVFTAWDEARLAQMGFALRADNLANPSGGVVRVPPERVGAARQIRIETSPHRLWHFALTGLDDALGAMKAAGC